MEMENNKSRQETVAAITVTYNRTRTLEKCIDALLNQTRDVYKRQGDCSGSYLCDHGSYILEQGQKVVRWSIAERLKKQFIS